MKTLTLLLGIAIGAITVLTFILVSSESKPEDPIGAMVNAAIKRGFEKRAMNFAECVKVEGDFDGCQAKWSFK